MAASLPTSLARAFPFLPSLPAPSFGPGVRLTAGLLLFLLAVHHTAADAHWLVDLNVQSNTVTAPLDPVDTGPVDGLRSVPAKRARPLSMQDFLALLRCCLRDSADSHLARRSECCLAVRAVQAAYGQ